VIKGLREGDERELKVREDGCGDQFLCFKRQKHAHNCVPNPESFQEKLRHELKKEWIMGMYGFGI